jgi:regulator of cell morphogenesis and NO signaling
MIVELEKEHDHAGEILRQIRAVTSDYTLPLDACGTYRLVYARLEALEELTFMHVHLENNILFPRYLS